MSTSNTTIDAKANFDTAKTLLSDGEKNRILAIYLNTKPDGAVRPHPHLLNLSNKSNISQTDWAAAAAAFGSASVDSMKVSTRTILKKLEAKGVTIGGDAGTTAGAGAGKGKKREAAAEADPEDDEEGGVTAGKGKKRKGTASGGDGAAPAKRGRGRPKKAVAEEAGEFAEL